MIAPRTSDHSPPPPVAAPNSAGINISFEGYGNALVTGPRADDLATLVTALPTLVQCIMMTLTALDTGKAPSATDLDLLLSAAGVTRQAMADFTTLSVDEEDYREIAKTLASVLATIDRELQDALDDRSNIRAPSGLKVILTNLQKRIRRALDDAGFPPVPDSRTAPSA